MSIAVKAKRLVSACLITSTLIPSVLFTAHITRAQGTDLSAPIAPNVAEDTVVSDWQIKVPPGNSILRAVSLVSETDGWAVGNSGALLRWNGSTWVMSATLGSSNLYGIDMVSANNGWIVGVDKIFGWNGSAWTEAVKPSGNILRAVSMVSNTLGYAVGDNGTILKYNGTNWNFTQSPISDTNLSLTAIDILAIDSGWAVGRKPDDSGNVILRFDGTSWISMTVPVTTSLYGVVAVSPVDAWAVGASGVILRWNGSIWSQESSPTANSLLGISMLSKTNGWAVGFGGSILRWDGTNWAVRTPPPQTGAIYAIDAVSNNVIQAGGENLLDYKPQITSTWQNIDKPAQMTIRSISMLSDNEGWAVGNDGQIAQWKLG